VIAKYLKPWELINWFSEIAGTNSWLSFLFFFIFFKTKLKKNCEKIAAVRKLCLFLYFKSVFKKKLKFFIFLKLIFFSVFRLFWCANIKNNFFLKKYFNIFLKRLLLLKKKKKKRRKQCSSHLCPYRISACLKNT